MKETSGVRITRTGCIGPDELRCDMVTFGALVEMFEMSYLSLAEVPPERELSEKEIKAREKACSACYHLQELADQIAAEMVTLAEHMEVCNAMFAANYIARNGGGRK